MCVMPAIVPSFSLTPGSIGPSTLPKSAPVSAFMAARELPSRETYPGAPVHRIVQLRRRSFSIAFTSAGDCLEQHAKM